MTLIQIGALRFHGLDADIASLPIGNSTLFGAIFDAVDTVRKFVFDGTAWVEFVSGTGEDNTGANVGAGTGLVFRDKIGVTLNFKSLIGGTNVTIIDNSDDITISSTGTSPLTQLGDLYTFTTVDARFPRGVDGQVLRVDDLDLTFGLKWKDLLTQKGNLLSFSTELAELPQGNDGQRLEVDDAETVGLKWVDNNVISQLNSSVTVSDTGANGLISLVADGTQRFSVDAVNGIFAVPMTMGGNEITKFSFLESGSVTPATSATSLCVLFSPCISAAT